MCGKLMIQLKDIFAKVDVVENVEKSKQITKQRAKELYKIMVLIQKRVKKLDIEFDVSAYAL